MKKRTTAFMLIASGVFLPTSAMFLSYGLQAVEDSQERCNAPEPEKLHTGMESPGVNIPPVVGNDYTGLKLPSRDSVNGYPIYIPELWHEPGNDTKGVPLPPSETSTTFTKRIYTKLPPLSDKPASSGNGSGGLTVPPDESFLDKLEAHINEVFFDE